MEYKTKIKLHKKSIIVILIIVSLLMAFAFLPSIIYSNRMYPYTSVNGISIGNLTQSEAQSKVNQSLAVPEKITLLAGDQEYSISLSDLEFVYDIPATLDSLRPHTQSSLFVQLVESWTALTRPHSSPLVTSLNELLLNEHLSVIADEITTKPVKPNLIVEQSRVTVSQGTIGTDINIAELQNTIIHNLALHTFDPIKIPVIIQDFTLSESESEEFKKRGEGIIGKSIVFQTDRYTHSLDEELISLLSASDHYNVSTSEAVITRIANDLNRDPVNPIFVYENNKVLEFSPAQDGIKVDTEKLSELLIEALQMLETSQETSITINIPLTNTSPSVSTEEVNNLGIKELIGYGESKFVGSIASRVHNIGLGASKFNGVLVAPDEVFSFNKTIGDISSLTGYKQSYVIQDGKTILGDGGGVCQVSTTLFRAALNAGLPIQERRSHSYRVTYYEQGTPPGLDATIYSPTTDLKIVNNTGNHLLIQTLFDPDKSTLVIEMYGTSDGREVSVSTPVVTSQSPAPEPLYIDDPTLPTGSTKQIDWAASGAKVSFDYKVTREGEILEDQTFYSNYHPWQAKFLRGTGPSL